MSNFSEIAVAAALAECGREPVHAPGAIQPNGCLICLDPDMGHVLKVSANLERFLGIPPDVALATAPRRLLGDRLLKPMRRYLAGGERLPGAWSVKRRVAGRTRHFLVTAYRSGQQVLIEFEPLEGAARADVLAALTASLLEIDGATCPTALLDSLVRSTQQLTGHDRVMVYRFDADGHGSVVAESRAPEAGGYLGHHFPASDIPPQVRRLFGVNPVRSIPDATAGPVPLISRGGHDDDPPLDLSPGSLRAVAPVHLTYLYNMGVGASLSIAMQDGAALWGLLACHGLAAEPLSPVVRESARALVQSATSRLLLLQARSDARYLREVRDSREKLCRDRESLLAPESLIQRHGAAWLALFKASGVAVVYHDRIAGLGVLPPEPRIKEVTDWLLRSQQREAVWCSHGLAETPVAGAVELTDCCGLLAVPLPIEDARPGWLLLFRSERNEIRTWAGKPEDEPVVRDGGLFLAPRRSFNAWREEIRGRSEPWPAIQQQAARDLGEDLAVLVSSRLIDQLNTRLNDANQRLYVLAHTDHLTRLPNRLPLQERAEAGIVSARRQGAHLALLYLDLDRFKHVNDSLGHPSGDALLQQVSARLQATVRQTDLVARLGGDEFAILLDGVKKPRDCGIVAGKLLEAFSRPFDIDGRWLYVSVSIGSACFPDDGDNYATLIHNADLAMYSAKQRGRSNHQSYVRDMAVSVAPLTMRTALHEALERQEFWLQYQPLVDLATGRITGMEALLRWETPGLGMVSPADFIPVAEETGLILPIGDWVLGEALRELRALHQAGHDTLRMAVNLSPRQFRQPGLVARVAELLEREGLEPGCLELEITETMMMEQVDDAIASLNALHRLGVWVALDDFGTGYSSLQYLKYFRITHLKIDRSFVDGIPDNGDDLAIVRSIIALAQSLEIAVIAEGVETHQQLATLRSLACGEAQGYLLSRPLRGEDLRVLLDSQARLPEP